MITATGLTLVAEVITDEVRVPWLNESRPTSADDVDTDDGRGANLVATGSVMR